MSAQQRSALVPAGYLLTTHEFSPRERTEWPQHAHPEHELLWSEGGVIGVEAADRVWTIPANLGVWLPSGLPHRVSADAGANVRATYFVNVASNMVAMPNEPTGVSVTTPLRALLTHNIQSALAPDARLRLQRVALDLLRPAPNSSFDLVLPRSRELRVLATLILDDPADRRTTADIALSLAMHPRTLARRFEAETGTTFTQWRILARIQRAIRELADGATVVSTSQHLGYRSPSTFISHFVAATGQTPAEFTRATSRFVAALESV